MLAPLFQQHRWANLTLIDFCMGLSEEQLATALPGQYGSILDTWQHITEERFIAAVEHGSFPPPSQPEGKPNLAKIRDRLDRTGTRAIELATQLDESARINLVFRGEPFDMPAYIPLIQVIQHGAEHRTNITTTLATLGLTPPGTDAWAFLLSGHAH